MKHIYKNIPFMSPLALSIVLLSVPGYAEIETNTILQSHKDKKDKNTTPYAEPDESTIQGETN